MTTIKKFTNVTILEKNIFTSLSKAFYHCDPFAHIDHCDFLPMCPFWNFTKTSRPPWILCAVRSRRVSHFSTPSRRLYGDPEATHNAEALSCLKIYCKSPPAGCPRVPPLPTIQKEELKCLHNGEPITTLSSGQEWVQKDVPYYWHFQYSFQGGP